MADSGRKKVDAIGPYELEREFVRSSWGSLFVGRVTEGAEQGKAVAVRRIELRGRDPEQLVRAAQAARVSLELRHLNVARVIDVLEDEVSLSVVSEYVDAVPLSAVMRACSSRGVQMPTGVALRIAQDVLAGLGAAHRLWSTLGEPAQWFFGGLEPGSVLINKTGNVRVFDLGVAACLVGDDLEADTLVYRAPERLDSTRSFDARAGVYSVGVLLWEMLANRRLFPSMLTAPPHVVAASLPDEVAAVVARALSREPGARFASADEMALELKNLPGEEPARANDVVQFLHRVRAEEGRSTRPPARAEFDAAEEIRIPGPPRLPGSRELEETSAKRAPEPAAELDMPTVPKKKAGERKKEPAPAPPKVNEPSDEARSSPPPSSRAGIRRRAMVAAAAVAVLLVAVGLLRLLGGSARHGDGPPPATEVGVPGSTSP